MLKNIINSVWSTVVEPTDTYDLQVYEKDLDRDCNVIMFGLFSYQPWKYFHHQHNDILNNLSEISHSELYQSIQKEPYAVWFFINKLITAVYFTAFIKITKAPKRLHEKLFYEFYESGIKEGLNRDNYHLGGDFYTEEQALNLIHGFMKYGTSVYNIVDEKNSNGISPTTIFLTEEIYNSLSLEIPKDADTNIHEKEILEKVLEEFKDIARKNIYANYSEKNRRNEII